MKPHLALIIAVSLPSLAQAGCSEGSQVLINCTFYDGAKSVTTCLQGDSATYAFGPTGGQAELKMSRHVVDVGMDPWHGFGRWIAEGLTFDNDDYAYALRYGIDRLSEDQRLEADLWVTYGDQTLAHLVCDAGSIKAGYPLPLFDAKIASGQTWDQEEMLWTTSDNK